MDKYHDFRDGKMWTKNSLPFMNQSKIDHLIVYVPKSKNIKSTFMSKCLVFHSIY